MNSRILVFSSLLVSACAVFLSGCAAHDKTNYPDRKVITTFVSWKTPLGSLNGNRYWHDYNYNRVKKNDANYPLINAKINIPSKPLKIGSQEYMDLTYPAAVEQLKEMKKAGIDVMMYDCMPLPKYDPEKPWTYDNIPLANYGMMPVWLKAATETDMKIGIFLESNNLSGDCPKRYRLNSEEDIKMFNAVLDNLPSGKEADALWKINGAPVIMHFATDSCMGNPPDKNAPAPDGGWRDVIAKLRKDGRKFYFIADIRTHTPNRQIWSKVANAVYDFSPAGPENFLADTGIEMKKFFDKLGTPYIFSSSPGYYNSRSYTEPDFKRIHDLYMAAIKNNASTVHIMTWNDTVEDTDIWPSNNKGRCLLDIYSFYNHWFKSGTKPQLTEENITLAYPKRIPEKITAKSLRWGDGRWVGRPWAPRVFYWANLKAPHTVKIDGAGKLKIPAGLSMGEFPGLLTVRDELEVQLDDKKLNYPGIKAAKKGGLRFRYINLMDNASLKK